jgi:hypothetical protein
LASGLGGAKAGILGAIFLAAAIGLFNVILLEANSGPVLAAFNTVASCTTPPTTTQDCFSTLITTYIPTFVIFPVAVLGILFGALYGMLFEYIPGRGYVVRAMAMGMGAFIVMLVFGTAGISADQTQKAALYAFDLFATVVYVLIIARFYKKFTRVVEFASPDPGRLKITCDGKNYTGKAKTLSLHSSHTVRAPSESGTFHQWLVSGGVSVLDPRSFETTMRVDGDGLLKIT